MLPTSLVALLVATPVASAAVPTLPIAPQVTDPDVTSGATAVDPAKSSITKRSERKLIFEIGIRGRYLILPTRIMDIAFEDDKPDYPWALRSSSQYCQNTPTSQTCGQVRPEISGWSGGLELLIKSNKSAGIIWFDYVDSLMPEGYWDEIDEGSPKPDDGDYLRPTPNLGLIMFGADYQFELPMVATNKTRGAFGLDFIVGTGLGLGILVGNLDRWESASGTVDPAYAQYDRGEAPLEEKSIPDFYPVLDFNVGLKFNFADRVTLRVEGGLHTLFYGGATLGFRF